MRIIHTMPLMIRSEPLNIEDITMASACFESLALIIDNALVIIYNQGLNNAQLIHLCSSFKLSTVILGEGGECWNCSRKTVLFRVYLEASYRYRIHI